MRRQPAWVSAWSTRRHTGSFWLTFNPRSLVLLTNSPREATGQVGAVPATTVGTTPLPRGSNSTAAFSTVAAPSPALVQAWGRDNGWEVGQRGRLPAGLLDAYVAAHTG